jgi:beta-glucanase (GH16 family)
MAMQGEEEFDGPAGAAPSSGYFGYDIGGTGWGNDERQVYTVHSDNVRLTGTGQMIIEARRNGAGFTSARVITRGKVDFEYGLLEARIRMPAGRGLHSALWMLGSNIAHTGWPLCGEVDIVEIVNSGLLYHNAVHGPLVADSSDAWKQSNDGDAKSDLSRDFHIYQVYRRPGLIRVGIDGRIVGEYTASAVPAGARWVFDAPMYLILNVAVGGAWPGPVDSSTVFPAGMLVDWIRYWK